MQDPINLSLLTTDPERLRAAMAVSTVPIGAQTHTVVDRSDGVFTWDYARSRDPVGRLYDEAIGAQWRAADLPWGTDVDPERMARHQATAMGGFLGGADVSDTAFRSWGEREWVELHIQTQNWVLSQFLHAEQGALLCAAKLVESVPWIDAKYCAATQVMDEARHVDVFTRYLDTKLQGHYPINAHLRAMLDDIVADARWDMTYLGMQVMVEGVGLAASDLVRRLIDEPLLDELLRRVTADEVRHLAFGVLALGKVYQGLTLPEIRERQEFAYDVALRTLDRFLAQEVWQQMGIPADQAVDLVVRSPERRVFAQMLFSRIVPTCRRVGLLDAGDGWLRQRFGELGVLGYEDDADDPRTQTGAPPATEGRSSGSTAPNISASRAATRKSPS
jgi:hypothetical protein